MDHSMRSKRSCQTCNRLLSCVLQADREAWRGMAAPVLSKEPRFGLACGIDPDTGRGASSPVQRPRTALHKAFLKRGTGKVCSTHGVDGSRKFRAVDGRVKTELIPKQRRDSIPTKTMVRRPASAPPSWQTKLTTKPPPPSPSSAAAGEEAEEEGEQKSLETMREELAAQRKRCQQER